MFGKSVSKMLSAVRVFWFCHPSSSLLSAWLAESLSIRFGMRRVKLALHDAVKIPLTFVAGLLSPIYFIAQLSVFYLVFFVPLLEVSMEIKPESNT